MTVTNQEGAIRSRKPRHWLRNCLLGGVAFGLSLTPSALSAKGGKGGQASPVQLAVEIVDLRNNQGNVAVALFNDEDAFPDQEKALQGLVVSPSNKRARVEFKGLKPGVYAVAVLHDENKNDKMDFNWVGMPQEGYGFSNDAPVRFGPPSYSKAAVRVEKQNSIIRIKTRYFSL